MKKLVVVFLLVFAPFGECVAQQFSAAGISLQVPEGFSGPISQRSGRTALYGYFKSSISPYFRTLLQISIFDHGAMFPKRSRDGMLEGSDKYLLQFLGGVERRRTAFTRSRISHITLGGVPASKILWHGRYRGLEVNGVMYCLLVGHYIISFHTQDAGDHITTNMRAAIESIESLSLTQEN